MLNGMFLDPRIWSMDILGSPLWNTQRYGINIELVNDAFNIPKTGIKKKYDFVLATEVWEIPMQKTLRYLRAKGIKVFLMPRETFIPPEKRDLLFSYPKFLYKGAHYFRPDAVMAPNQVYAGYWKGKTKVVETGYPRFDYLAVENKINRAETVKKYKLNPNKKIIFFPSYPPYYHKTDGTFLDLYSAREQTLQILEGVAKESEEYQVVAKIHPMSFKCFKKGTGTKKEVTGTLLKYYKHPTDFMTVIGDERMSGAIAKELLLVSDVVIGFNSTMLLESLALNKPTLHVLLGETKNTNFDSFAGHMETAYDKDGIEKFIDGPIVWKDRYLVDRFLAGADGRSCERICKVINEETK